ncbi:MAG: GlsB/YeaQ/YmgE family stress response membrane protein [Bauldia sp.]
MSTQSLIIIGIVGVLAGWIAGQVIRGGGFGLIGDLIVGVVGALLGGWLLPRVGIHIDPAIAVLIITATIGAIVLLLLLRLVRRV